MPLGHRHILGKDALPVPVGADHLPVGAQVVVTLPALVALAAPQAHVRGDAVADLEVPNVPAHSHDGTAPLMPRNDGILGKAVFDVDHVAGQQLDIRGAEACVRDLRQHLIVLRLGRCHRRILDDLRLHKTNCFH